MQITDSTLVATVRALASALPEHVYSNPVPDSERNCLYVHPATDSTPATGGCIIGKALSTLGVPLDDIAHYEGEGAMTVIPGVGGDLSYETLLWAGHVQVQQDAGRSWSQAVHSADEVRPITV